MVLSRASGGKNRPAWLPCSKRTHNYTIYTRLLQGLGFIRKSDPLAHFLQQKEGFQLETVCVRQVSHTRDSSCCCNYAKCMFSCSNFSVNAGFDLCETMARSNRRPPLWWLLDTFHSCHGLLNITTDTFGGFSSI